MSNEKQSEVNDLTTPEYQPPIGDLVSFQRWLDSIGITAATGWRWRRDGRICTTNVAGRLYLSRAEIKRFEERAAKGEFSKVHATPARIGADQR
jgi:hypothetical protein